jgi:hypothetical protein
MFAFNFSPIHRDDEMVLLMMALKKLACISNIQEQISPACDTSFLYWHRVLVSVYFDAIFDNKLDAYRLSVSSYNDLYTIFPYLY